MKKIASYLKEKYGSWGWMGQRAHDAEGIDRILPLDFIISCNHGTDTPIYFSEENVFSVEKENGVRRDWSNEDLNASLKGKIGRKIFSRWSNIDGQINLLCYRSVKKLENYEQAFPHKLKIYAAPVRLKKKFDNKLLLCKNLEKLSLPLIPFIIDRPGRITFQEVKERLSAPFVVQSPYGSSGSNTYVIRKKNDFNRLKNTYPEQTMAIRKYIDGFSLNVNGVIVSQKNGPVTYCSFPSLQITGTPECSNLPKAYCGNDYASAGSLGKDIIEQVKKSVETIGSWMGESGFRGIFGMDFIVGDGQVYPVEINPRFQNSTSLFTTLESMQRSRKASLFLLHIAEFLQGEDKNLRNYIKTFDPEELMQPLKGSQIILHNKLSKNIVTGEFIPGIYKIKDNKLKFAKSGASVTQCSGDEVLITCGVPKPFTPVEPNAPLCKIQVLKPVLDPENKREFNEIIKKVISNVYDKLALVPEKNAVCKA